MTHLVPTFLEGYFDFGDKETPEHVDGFPDVAGYIGVWAIFSSPGGDKSIQLASDIPTEEMARDLALAHAAYQERTLGIYKYSNDVYILHPDGNMERTYFGRHIDDN